MTSDSLYLQFLKKFALKFPILLKTKNRVKTLAAEICCFIGISGAKVIGITSNGNTILRLNRDYPLGARGSVIQIPRDKKMFEKVRRHGSWELKISKFIADGLKISQQLNENIALLDIGANVGLVTLQSLNISRVACDVFLFEPIPQHAKAINHNLVGLANIKIYEVALSDQSGVGKIFTQNSNRSNTSILRRVVPEFELIETDIVTLDTAEFCKTNLKNYDSYIIKCDIQGMDALVLSRIPNEIWQNLNRAVIELWALPEVEKNDVENLLLVLKKFKFLSWHPSSKKTVSISEIKNFWLSGSLHNRNLFLSKTAF